MTKIDRLAPYRQRPRTLLDGDVCTRPPGVCMGCQAAILTGSNYNPMAARLDDGGLVCHWCLLLLMQVEHAGWHVAQTAPRGDLWHPWPPSEGQLACTWTGHTYVDYRTTYTGPRRG